MIPDMRSSTCSVGGVIRGASPMKRTSALWLPLPWLRWKARIGSSRPPTSFQLVIPPE